MQRTCLFSDKLSLSTVKMYEGALMRLSEGIWHDKTVKLGNIDDADTVLEFTNNFGPNMEKIFIMGCILFLKQFETMEGAKDIVSGPLAKYRAKYHEITKEMKKNQHVISETEKQNWATWAEISAIPEKYKDFMNRFRKKHEKKTTEELMKNGAFSGAFQKYVIMSLYTLLPPVRLDYANTLFVNDHSPAKDDGEHNVVDLHKKKIILRQFKTAKKWGVVEIDIVPELFEILKEWAEANKTGWLLFGIHTKQPMNETMLCNTLAEITQRILDKRISVNMLRKIYVSEKFKISLQEIEDKKETARIMCHSTGTQNSSYQKDLAGLLEEEP